MNAESTKILFISGANHNSVGCDEQQLRFVHDDLCHRFTHFELGAYFLDLGGVLRELRCQNFHPILLLRACRPHLVFPGAENGEGQSGDYSPGGYRFQSAFEIKRRGMLAFIEL